MSVHNTTQHNSGNMFMRMQTGSRTNYYFVQAKKKKKWEQKNKLYGRFNKLIEQISKLCVQFGKIMEQISKHCTQFTIYFPACHVRGSVVFNCVK